MENQKPWIKFKSFSIIIFSFVVLFQGQTGAEDKAVFEMQLDGIKIIKDQEGSFIQIKPDGSKVIGKVDGTSIEVKADGSKSFMIKGALLLKLKLTAARWFVSRMVPSLM